MMQSIELGSDEGSLEEGNSVGKSITWRFFSKSTKSKEINKDSVLYPILRNLNENDIAFTDLNFSEIKVVFKGLLDTKLFQDLFYVFKQVAWPIWWFFQGSLSPGAIMFLGRFVLKLAVFSTILVAATFLASCALWGLANIISNLFIKARQSVFERIEKDAILLEKMMDELDRYLGERKLARHLSLNNNDGEFSAELLTLGGDINSPERLEFENKLFLAMKSAQFTIENNLDNNWFLKSSFIQGLNGANNVFKVATNTLFGFGVFIFTMMTLNIWFPMSLPFILVVIIIASVSASIHAGMEIYDALEKADKNAALLNSVNDKLSRLNQDLDDFKRLAPHIKTLDDYQYPSKTLVVEDFEEVENSLDEEHDVEEKPVSYILDPGQFETKYYYQPRFIGSLNEVAGRTMYNPTVLDDFVEYARSAPSA